MADVLDVLEAARALARGVVVDDPAVGVERHQQRRRRVHDRLEEGELRAQLGLQPFVVEPERRRSRDRVDELGLVRERRIVDERSDQLAVPSDVVPYADAGFALERAAVRQDELLALGQPVDEVERRVAQGVGERVPDRDAAAELDDQVGDAAPGEPAPEHPGQERHRDERERDQEDEVERVGRVLRDRVHDQLDEEDDHDERPRAEHRAERAAESAAGAQIARDHDCEHGDDERERQHADDAAHERVGGVAAGDGDRARTRRAARVRLLVDQQLREGADEDERVRADDEPEVPAPLQPAGRVREQQLDERARARGCSRARRS